MRLIRRIFLCACLSAKRLSRNAFSATRRHSRISRRAPARSRFGTERRPANFRRNSLSTAISAPSHSASSPPETSLCSFAEGDGARPWQGRPLCHSRYNDFCRSRQAASSSSRPRCQSACKFAPSSASNFDPFARRGLAVALVSSELAGIAEARRARVA